MDDKERIRELETKVEKLQKKLREAEARAEGAEGMLDLAREALKRQMDLSRVNKKVVQSVMNYTTIAQTPPPKPTTEKLEEPPETAELQVKKAEDHITISGDIQVRQTTKASASKSQPEQKEDS